MRQTLYRKYRPNKFSRIAGQEHITNTLKNAIATNRLAHAYLFSGPRGTGKTTTGRVLAAALNCLSPASDLEPCNKCENCISIANGSFMDLIEMDAASNTGVDDVRELKNSVGFACTSGKKKVYLIDEVHMMSRSAFNALLKTLEEPPSHVLFILATTEAEKVPPTVLSRCQHFEFRSIKTKDIIQQLEYIAKSEAEIAGIDDEISQDSLALLAYAAKGGLRDAISLLDQAISFCGPTLPTEKVNILLGTVNLQLLNKLGESIKTRDLAQALQLLDDFSSNGGTFTTLATDWLRYLSRLLTIKASPDIIKDGDQFFSIRDKMMEQSSAFSVNQLANMIETAGELLIRVKNSDYPETFMDAAWAKWCAPEKEMPIYKEIASPKEPQIILERTSLKEAENHVKVTDIKEGPTPKRDDDIPIIPQSTPPPKIKKKEIEKSDIPDKITTGSLNFEIVQEKWPIILEKIKSQSPWTHAYIIEAKLVAFEDNTVIIGYKPNYDYHKNRVGDNDQRTVIEKNISLVLGTDTGFRAISLDSATKTENKENKKDENISHKDPLVNSALKIFGGDVVYTGKEEKNG